MEMIIFGSILTPFVSSSKNLSKPALDAGSGAFFFLPSAILVMRHNNYVTRRRSIAQDSETRLIGKQMMIFGSILTPFVSSSKNLSKPALDAGSGAFFFLPSAILGIEAEW